MARKGKAGPKDQSISAKLRFGKLKIAIYGLGNVGSPIASAWLRAGAHVIAVDKSPEVRDYARKGKTLLLEPGVAEAFSRGLKEKRFQVYDDPVQASRDSDVKMVCVPVLLSGSPPSADLGALVQVASSIAKGLKPGDIVVLNPSVPPGTTEDVIIPILENESSLKAESNFFVVYNPERIYEGRAIQDVEQSYPAIVAGAGPKSTAIGSSLLSIIYKKGVIATDNIRTAETEKLLEGVYRDVNIALANEMAKLCEKIGVDFWQAREAANSQPFCHIHRAGAGVGGACIPVYPQFIIQSAEAAKADCNITRLGRNTNDSMPSYCVEQALQLAGSITLAELSVTLLGLAFRGGISDTRLSPTYRIIKELKRIGVGRITVHDPLVKADPTLDVKLTSDLAEALAGADLAILVTDHKQYSSLSGADLGNVPVYDGRGILDPRKFARLGGIGNRK